MLLSNCGVVRVGASRKVAAVLGRVNMDQIIVDLTDVAEAAGAGWAEAAPASEHLQRCWLLLGLRPSFPLPHLPLLGFL